MIPRVLGNKESGERRQNSLTAASQVDHRQLSARKFKMNLGIVLFCNFPSFFHWLAGRFCIQQNNRHFHELFV